MKIFYLRQKSIFVCIMCIFICISAVNASEQITQTFSIQPGWNAIFVNLSPSMPEPDNLFTSTPVKQVLTYYPLLSSVDFIQSPDEIEWNAPGWNRWVPQDQKESMFNTLHAISQNQAYLIFSEQAFTLSISGTPGVNHYQWIPDSYNLTGFYVNPDTPPTFAQYFEGSTAHTNTTIFTLEGSKWKQVEPSIANIEYGKAYWVFCNGGSTYGGPLEIQTSGVDDKLIFRVGSSELSINLTNHSPGPLSVNLQKIDSTTEGELVPLSIITYSSKMEKEYISLTSYDQEIEPDESLTIRMAVQQKMITNDVSCLIKVTDSLGNLVYIPVNAEKVD